MDTSFWVKKKETFTLVIIVRYCYHGHCRDKETTYKHLNKGSRDRKGNLDSNLSILVFECHY